MNRIAISALILSVCAATASAQEDALLPTHLIDGGQVFATGSLRYIGGQGDATLFGTADGDFDQTAFQFQVDAGVGLGQGFEIGASIYVQFKGETKTDISTPNAELNLDSEGFSDLLLYGRYRILQDSATMPQLVVGALVIAPVGNDKDGQPEIKTNGIVTQQGEEAGIGQGVWKYGVEAGISKNLGLVEPYFYTSYVFGDKRTENGVDEDRADVWNLLIGAQWHITPKATIDTRVLIQRSGVDKEENNGSQTEEEAHLTYGGQVSLYVHLGSGVTFLFGGGVTSVEDHEVNDLLQLEVKDDLNWFLGVGLHVLIGAK